MKIHNKIEGVLDRVTVKQILGFIVILLLVDICLQVLNLIKPNVISTGYILESSLDMPPKVEEVINTGIDPIQEELKNSPQISKQKFPLKAAIITTLVASLVGCTAYCYCNVSPETIDAWFTTLNNYVIEPTVNFVHTIEPAVNFVYPNTNTNTNMNTIMVTAAETFSPSETDGAYSTIADIGSGGPNSPSNGRESHPLAMTHRPLLASYFDALSLSLPSENSNGETS